LDPDNVVVKLRQNLEYDREFFEDHEPDWNYMMFWPNKCAYVDTCDDDESLSANIRKGHETHASLNQTIATYVSDDVFERTQTYNYIEFFDQIKQILRLTRVLSFT